MGQAPDGSAYNDTRSGWPLIAGAGDFSGIRPNPKKFTSQASKLSMAGDIILGIRASIGAKVWADGEYCLGRGVAALRAGPRVEPNYLWHWLTMSRDALASKGRGATFLQVNRSDIVELPISLPPLPEQRRIASILDQADELRAKRLESIGSLTRLAFAVFDEAFGSPARTEWPVGIVGALLESASYGTSAKARSTGAFPILRMGNITRTGDIDLTDLKYIDLKPEEAHKYLVKRGDVLFNRTNSADLVGKSAVVRHATDLAYAGYLVRLRLSEDNSGEYLAGYLNSAFAKAKLRSMAKSIVGMANINAKEVQQLPIPIPSSKAQQDYATQIGEIESTKSAHRAHLAKLDELFASLQHRAFAGEL